MEIAQEKVNHQLTNQLIYLKNQTNQLIHMKNQLTQNQLTHVKYQVRLVIQQKCFFSADEVANICLTMGRSVLLSGEEALSIDLECEFDDNRSGASDSADASCSEDANENLML